jgi:hypothetical protein
VILSDPSHKEWTVWDYRLIKAYHLKQGFMSGNFPVWLDRDENVWFEAKNFVSRSEAVIEAAQEKESTSKNGGTKGKRFYAVIKGTRNGGPLPTLRDFLEKQAVARGQKSDAPVEKEQIDLPIQGVD